MRNNHPYILAAVLAAIGIAIFVYKYVGLGLPLTAEQSTETWQIETRVSFQGSTGPVKVSIPFPTHSGRYTVIDQNFVAPGYGLFTEVEGPNRRAVFAIRDTVGQQVLYAGFTVHRVPRASELIPMRDAPPEPTTYLTGARLLAATSVLDMARDISADVPTMTLAILKHLRQAGTDDKVDALLGKRNDPLEIAKAAVSVLGLAGVPARVVNGVRLVPGARNVQIIHWIEVFSEGNWRSYLLDANVGGLPEHYFPWWRGDEAFVQSNMPGKVETATTVARATETTGRSALVPLGFMERNLLDFSLLTLPLDVQQVYRIILMVPVGVLVLVLLRNVVGLITFGTFMPVLIALSFRETTLIWGIVLFTFVVGVGLLARFYLEYLKLLVVPRLACVLIVVIMVMAALSILAHKLGVDRGLAVALFPLIIITMTIERMSIVWDEAGAADALKQGVGSLIAATLSYGVMSITYLEHLMFVYPEILLVLLAITLVLGRYSGYRLTEIWRFREFTKLESR